MKWRVEATIQRERGTAIIEAPNYIEAYRKAEELEHSDYDTATEYEIEVDGVYPARDLMS